MDTTATDIPTLTVTAPSEREIALARVFEAPRERVFEALTAPDLLRRWLLGPPGWSMTACEAEARVGGTYRYAWRHERDGTGMGMGGIYREVSAPGRISYTERFDEPWYAGEALVTGVLDERDGRTTLTTTIRYASREARDTVLKSGIKEGVAASYDRMAALLAAEPARGA